jgi:hypothetical protein
LALRDISEPVDPRVFEETSDPHVLSLQLTGAMWECLIQMYEAARAGGSEPEPAFGLARTALQRMIVRGLDYLPPADATFAEFGAAVYRADRFANPTDANGFRAAVARTLSLAASCRHGLDRRRVRAVGGWTGCRPRGPARHWPRPTCS